ncbi:uncharacterized protein LOC124842535 [Vigna umbellata]|uniref:uncharacterized protein LOC124842535 n=1 Tax=Vigna umbellata TaxID=87088 RepID=UPI001F5EEA9A|nr:uncharacterized protein LOC124842535 [Vigna umbellata]
MEALDLWDVAETNYEVLSVPDNPIMAQIKIHKERKTRKAKEEYAGDERIRSMQVLNLMREFELQRMKESEKIKEYSDKLLGIANKIRLLSSNFPDSRIVENILVTVPEKYEAFISSLENTRDLSKITFEEVLHAFQAHEQ